MKEDKAAYENPRGWLNKGEFKFLFEEYIENKLKKENEHSEGVAG